MKNISSIFESSWAQSLAMTLIHSLWQSLFILLIVIILFRFVSGKDAVKRYYIATSALLLMFGAAIVTFSYLQLTKTQAENSIPSFRYTFSASATTVTPETSFLESVTHGIQSNLSLITVCWLAGTIIFMMRLVVSWWYVSILRNQSIVVSNAWAARVRALATQLNIHRTVLLVESHRITAPAVIGVIKPVILLPVGFLAGLSTDQIESILMHELVHIRRHDYLINMLQSLIETLFFFNPVIWIVSGIIRTEREHCCDDAVVGQADASAYARALAHLEEIRLSRAGFAIALAENKHQLLNRIKRIMEKSAKNYSGREKMIPVLLLLAGLICASWITIQNTEDFINPDREKISADTTGKKKTKNKIATRDHQIYVVEQDQAPIPAIAEVDGDFIFALPDPVIAPMPAIDFIPPIAPDFTFNFSMDTVPIHFGPSHDWKAFSEEFEKKFKEEFGDFYQKHQADFDKMMQDLEKNFKNRFDENFATALQEQAEFMQLHAVEMEKHAEAMAAQHEAMAALQAIDMEKQAQAMAYQEQAMKEIEKQMHEQEKVNAEQMRAMEADMKKMEANMKRFEEALRIELIKDGYLKKDQKINNMHWNDEGDIEINGVKIKDSDKKKYNDLHQKFFKDSKGEFHYVE